MTIEELKQQGYEVKVSHLRALRGTPGSYQRWVERQSRTAMTRHDFEANGHRLADDADIKGGFTRVTLLKDGQTVAIGESICRPDENFSRKLGLQIALGRAVKQAGLRQKSLA